MKLLTPRSLYFKPPIALHQKPPMPTLHKLKPGFDYDRRRRGCQRHPKHRQSPGVCSLCLTEKLSRILSTATTSSRETSDSLSSSSSSYSSCSSSCYSSASSRSSPDRPSAKASFVFSASSIFRKSRSMAFGRRLRGGIESEKKSKLGFWARFMSRPTNVHG